MEETKDDSKLYAGLSAAQKKKLKAKQKAEAEAAAAASGVVAAEDDEEAKAGVKGKKAKKGNSAIAAKIRAQ